MREHHFVTVRPYLAHALAATTAVIGIPAAVAILWVATAERDPSFFALLVVSFLLAIVLFAIGATWWGRREASADISFGELMIWGWLARRQADERLDEGAHLLGLDRSGQPKGPVALTPDRQLEVLHELNAALESKDPYTLGHSQRVERHAYRTATAMGLPTSAIEELRMAAALHDVGKIRVPDRVLRKPGELTIEERAVVEEHVVVGAWMVSNVATTDVVKAVRHHHERWDGGGYPDGLAGTDVPLYARIIAVADAYDAITSTRPYRTSADREHAIDVLRAEAGTQFDPMVVTAFVEALPVRLPVAGLMVLLAGPAELGRRLTMWLKRLGSGHLAPTAATLTAIVTLGAFIPSLMVPPRSEPAIAQPAPIEVEVEGDSLQRDGQDDRRSIGRDHDVRIEVTEVSDAPVADVVLADATSRTDESDPARDRDRSKPDRDNGPPAVGGGGERGEDKDRGNPNDGKDGCPNDGNAGTGNDWNCGAKPPPPPDKVEGREEEQTGGDAVEEATDDDENDDGSGSGSGSGSGEGSGSGSGD